MAKLFIKALIAGAVGSAVGQMVGPRVGIQPASGPGVDDLFNGGVGAVAFIVLDKVWK